LKGLQEYLEELFQDANETLKTRPHLSDPLV